MRLLSEFKKRFAVYGLAVLLSFCCFACAFGETERNEENGGETSAGIAVADMIESADAIVAFEKKSAANKMAFDGVSVRSDRPYAGKIKGVFGTGGDSFVLRFGFLAETWSYTNRFEFTFTSVSDPSVSFSLVYAPWYVAPTIGHPDEESGYTGCYLQYKNLKLYRHDMGDIQDGYGTGAAQAGEYTRVCPKFSFSWGSDTGGNRLTYGALSLMCDENGFWHLRTLEESYNPTVNTYANLKDIAVFDGSESEGAFVPGNAQDKSTLPCIRWGLPTVDFHSGFVVSFRTLESSPDVYFTAIDGEESYNTVPLCDFSKERLQIEPEFYKKYKINF